MRMIFGMTLRSLFARALEDLRLDALDLLVEAIDERHVLVDHAVQDARARPTPGPS